jgi:RNA polymerase sigma-70 factor (ECF subfamily)
LCRKLGQLTEARASYEKARALARQEPERWFLAGRLAELKIKIGSAVDFPSA